MGTEQQKEELGERIKNAASGYAVVLLGIACFLIALAVITIVVRLVVGASTGASV